MLKQCYTQAKLYSITVIAFKMAYSCCFGLRVNLDFPDFHQKTFNNLNYRGQKRKFLRAFSRPKFETILGKDQCDQIDSLCFQYHPFTMKLCHIVFKIFPK